MCIRDRCYILKTARCDPFHQFLWAVQILHKLHQGGGNQVRQMAHAGRDKIMLPVIQHQRKSLQGGHKGHEFLYRIFGNAFARRDNIVGIFDQMDLGIRIAGLLGTRPVSYTHLGKASGSQSACYENFGRGPSEMIRSGEEQHVLFHSQ